MNNSCNFEERKKEILCLRVNKKDNIISLHKYILILSLISLFDNDEQRENYFPLNEVLEAAFASQWFSIFGNKPANTAVENPYFHLQSDGFWFLVPYKGKERLYEFYKDSPDKRMTKTRLIETVHFGYLDDYWYSHLQDKNIREQIKKDILNICRKSLELEKPSVLSSLKILRNEFHNPYVHYLNTLHSRDGGNENALAESQACNDFFKKIHVPHPLVKEIKALFMEGNKKSVILTGHAGDGKSTIALGIFKHFKRITEDSTLAEPLQRREDLSLADGTRLAIIKDFSEWSPHEKMDLLSEVISCETKFLLVSNTGTLLDAFCSFTEMKNAETRATLEPRLLNAMNRECSDFPFEGIDFRVYNLSLDDNLFLARKIFEKMLAEDNWACCAEKECEKFCPISMNVKLFKTNNGLALDRLFLAYRRMYEYGTKLTLRQLTAHFSYMLTSGMEYSDVLELAARSDTDKPLLSEYLFYNRVFGDSGKEEDQRAMNLKAIKEFRSQGFAELPCPAIERNLWLLKREKSFSLGVESLEDEFSLLIKQGSRAKRDDLEEISPDQAREQVRRMLYFLHDFQNNTGQKKNYLRQFLGSISIVQWIDWQPPASDTLSLDICKLYLRKLFRVLQEQYTGVQFPEDGDSGQISYLYVTLSRHRKEVRQSTQVVLAKVDFFQSFTIILQTLKKRRDLLLKGSGKFNGVDLKLDLPFLDYILARHQGEISETLQASYIDRLERLKIALMERSNTENENEMLVVRLQTDNTFRRQIYRVTEGRLEVAND